MTAGRPHQIGEQIAALRTEIAEAGREVQGRRLKHYGDDAIRQELAAGTATPEILEALFRIVGDEFRAGLLCWGYRWKLSHRSGDDRLPYVPVNAFEVAVHVLSYDADEIPPKSYLDTLSKPPSYEPKFWAGQTNRYLGYHLFQLWAMKFLVHRAIGEADCLSLRRALDDLLDHGVAPPAFSLPMTDRARRLLDPLESTAWLYPVLVDRKYEPETNSLEFGTPLLTYTISPVPTGSEDGSDSPQP